MRNGWHRPGARAHMRRVCAGAELEIVFQPLVDLENNDFVAYEALARFPEDPERTTSGWFAAARELGVGAQLELIAIRAALGHLDDIPSEAALAINVSPTLAVTRKFFAILRPRPHRLMLELTGDEPG